MSSSDISPILEDLAAGRIDAAEASRRIDAVRASSSDTPTPDPSEQSSEWHQPPAASTRDHVQDPPRRQRAAGTHGVDRILVHAIGRRVRIVSDSSVATVAAEGPHVLRRNGSTLEVTSDGELGPNLDGFSFLRPPRSLDDLRSMGLGKELYLRVNPSIVLDVEVTAGSLTSTDVPYLGKVRVTAGAATLSGVSEVADLLTQAGQVTVAGTITSGRSRLRCESGQVTLRLGEHSDVVVRGESQLGKIMWSGQHTGNADEVTMGAGTARIDLNVVMGLASVVLGRVEDDQDATDHA